LRRPIWRILTVLIMFLACKQAMAQAPAASGPRPKEAQVTGMTLNTAFNGSADSDSSVYDWTTTTGYIFDKHFSANVGVPILVVRGTTSTGTTTSNSGLGNISAQLQFANKNPVLNFGAVATVALPTGDRSKGLSTGRVTFDWTNQMAKELGRFTPFLSAGVANSIFDSVYRRLPYTTLGTLAHFEAGTAFDLGRSLTISASAYDIAPWGMQKVYSRVVRKGSSGAQASKHGRIYLDKAVTSGGSSIDSDNGFNADLDFNPWKYVDCDFGFSHSVHYQLNTFSFGVSFNLSSLLRREGISRN